MSRQIVVRIAVRGTVLDGCPGLAITRDNAWQMRAAGWSR